MSSMVARPPLESCSWPVGWHDGDREAVEASISYSIRTGVLIRTSTNLDGWGMRLWLPLLAPGCFAGTPISGQILSTIATLRIFLAGSLIVSRGHRSIDQWRTASLIVCWKAQLVFCDLVMPSASPVTRGQASPSTWCKASYFDRVSM